MDSNTNTHKVITTKSTGVTGRVITERTYRGVPIRKRKDGQFEYVAVTYYAGLRGNNWHAAGLNTLKRVVADIDNRIDNLGWTAVGGRLLSPSALEHLTSINPDYVAQATR